jgi:hypothetical protein
MISPAGTADSIPSVSAVPSGLADLLEVFPGLASWATFKHPCGTELMDKHDASLNTIIAAQI